MKGFLTHCTLVYVLSRITGIDKVAVILPEFHFLSAFEGCTLFDSMGGIAILDRRQFVHEHLD
jgi:hypothetical protein